MDPTVKDIYKFILRKDVGSDYKLTVIQDDRIMKGWTEMHWKDTSDKYIRSGYREFVIGDKKFISLP